MILLIAGSLATLTAAAAVAWNFRSRRAVAAEKPLPVARAADQGEASPLQAGLECPICAAQAEKKRRR